MAEDFSDISNKSLWALLQNFVHIVEVLKAELPFEYLFDRLDRLKGSDNRLVAEHAPLVGLFVPFGPA